MACRCSGSLLVRDGRTELDEEAVEIPDVGDGLAPRLVDRRGHHVVTFPAAADDDGWAEALAALVKDGRARSVEVRKVNGEPISPTGGEAQALLRAGFVEGYKGFTIRG